MKNLDFLLLIMYNLFSRVTILCKKNKTYLVFCLILSLFSYYISIARFIKWFAFLSIDIVCNKKSFFKLEPLSFIESFSTYLIDKIF